MKLWQGILISFLIVVIAVLGYNYVNVSKKLDILIVEYDKRLAENIKLKEETEIKVNEALTDYISSSSKSPESETGRIIKLENTIHQIANNNVVKYKFYDDTKEIEENIETYLNYMCKMGGLLGANVPEFKNPNELEESYLDQVLWSIHNQNEDIMIMDESADAIISRTFIQYSLLQLFGLDMDLNKVDFSKLESIYPIQGYNDLFRMYAYREGDELQNADFVVTNIETDKDNYEVKFVEYSLEDREVILDVSEKTKTDLKDAEGNVIKTYDLELVKGEKEGVVICKYTDGQKEVKREDIEKFVLENKEKFIEKEMIFKRLESGLNISSCKVID